MMAGYAVGYSVEFVLKLVVETADLIKVFGTNSTVYVTIKNTSAKRRGCLLSYSQAEPGRELTQHSPAF